MVMGLRDRQLQHIRCLDVRHILEQAHQLRQVVEPGKAGLGPVSRAFRGKLNGRDGFAVVCRPGVEVL